jgi:ubiquinone/menaquinone biosynthesis C-methylase UbiE
MKNSTTPEILKKEVKNKYSLVIDERSSCCESPDSTNHLVKDYSNVNGYVASADYSLGCGIPTEYAGISEGQTVLDLGSGAGNDVFVARSIVGENGFVIGVDFTEKMIDKANDNKAKLGYTNIDFRYGDIEELPVMDNSVDVVLSNCVINLVPDKEKAFREIYRVLRPGGHFCISDMVVDGDMPEALRKDLSLYAGCVAGAVSRSEYFEMLEKIGFVQREIKNEKTVIRSKERVEQRYTGEKAEMYWNLRDKLFSITFFAKKPV